MARKNKRGGAVLGPHGKRQPGYDNYLMRRRGANIVPLPTRENPMVPSKPQKQVVQEAPRLHAKPKTKKILRAGSHQIQSADFTRAPSPLCDKLEFQPAPTTIKAIPFVPVIIDFEPNSAKRLTTSLKKSSGMPIKTMGNNEAYDIAMQDSNSKQYTTRKLVEIAFGIAGAPYVAILREQPKDKNWLAHALQTALDLSSPLAILTLGEDGVFNHCSLLLDRDVFLTNSGIIDQRFWRIAQRATLV